MFRKAMIGGIVLVLLAVTLADAEIIFFDNSNDFFQSTNIIHTEIFENSDEGFFPAEFDSFIYDGEGKIGHTTWRIDNAPGFNIPISSFVLYSPAVGIDFLKLKSPFSAIGFDFAAPYNFETIGNTIFIEVTEIDNQVTTYEYIQKDDPNGVWEYYGFVSNVGISQIKVYNDEADGILDDNFVFDNVSNSAIVPIPDTTPPELIDFSFTPTSIDVSIGSQDVILTMHVTDDLSGFNHANVTFQSPSGQNRIGTVYSTDLISGTKQDGIFEASMSFPQFAETGTWRVNSVFLDDPWDNQVSYSEAQLIAMGFPTELDVVCEPTIEIILNFFDQAVTAGTLFGSGPGKSADGRLYALRSMLVAAKELIDSGNMEEACGQLKAAYKKCDGDKPDFVDGAAAPELSEKILELMVELGCE